MEIKIIGAGGIGTHLLPPLCRYLDNLPQRSHIVVLDGDRYETKNAERQEFDRLGNKAEVTSEVLAKRFPRLEIEPRPIYLTTENAFVFIREGDIVFSCVDNHATRLLLSEHCASLQSVVLISGGNEYADGNVQVYVRWEGRDITPPLTHLHPEIADPKDRNPDEMSCEELARAGSPQLIFTNLLAASLMLNAFWLVTVKTLPYTEAYFDLLTGAVRPINRNGETR
ncbi:MAG: hypothetical protein A3J08_04375 [Candidatus Lloydbacteria bacterium RIFCSPLOWO2_02_FULL_51_11]|uniref:THIF-type NAD/FAD binding fold domain-containing protein n=1 Tax=Candidatus Lloydbacteria bacterium RIFCSPLOWO2_02_FULL_51_11 TaxID=1798667 RepID=A0A1G2DPA5_9BACT|nr:MAG: hypothetical protein A3J08_04375 [Candidatus Lloydbacteria bacterium RIFCSPLOWO2_02_FULL_51_11]